MGTHGTMLLFFNITTSVKDELKILSKYSISIISKK
ncbi:hypothetical protein GGR28_002864 [Lewinella aquimaris]|uniref:Uncharacterized protein n=1 Tax=Neolewinella aquimaris TaxID=1835722 RepID=A0A840E3S0_9BACT|nr:hypothetical protein [Neolewinella aquimaris]